MKPCVPRCNRCLKTVFEFVFVCVGGGGVGSRVRGRGGGFNLGSERSVRFSDVGCRAPGMRSGNGAGVNAM